MELALASAIGVLAAIGVYLLLRARSFDVILGMTFLSYATNLLIFSAGRLVTGKAPVIRTALSALLWLPFTLHRIPSELPATYPVTMLSA